ncbi:MAG: response regulator [Flavisolibacter sp.]|nr:response regulator [Flavisolibacter sp.]
MILKGHGYQTVLATSAKEALEQIELYQPQVILMDICLCDDDGEAVCQRIKTNVQTSGIRIILMSGHEKPNDAATLADDFLAKPFDYTELIHKVEKQVALIHAA